MPIRGTSNMELNPFHSRRVQDGYLLDAARPANLPSPEDSFVAEPLSNASGANELGQMSDGTTGKGRGSMSAGTMDNGLPGSTRGLEGRRTEGKLPEQDAGVKTMGPVNGPTGRLESQRDSEGLPRALEGELVSYLREQNSRLMDELATLRDKLEKTSGVESSPWSDLGAVGSSDGPQQLERQGRQGSRTPRARVREAAVSPERKRQPQRFTPNGTKVPDGPPPDDEFCWPPIPPIPGIEKGQNVVEMENMSGLYDTCESKPRVRNGDREWKPQCDGVVSANEAKQFWLEQEVKSLRKALDRVAVPTAFQESGYWKGEGSKK